MSHRNAWAFVALGLALTGCVGDREPDVTVHPTAYEGRVGDVARGDGFVQSANGTAVADAGVAMDINPQVKVEATPADAKSEPAPAADRKPRSRPGSAW